MKAKPVVVSPTRPKIARSPEETRLVVSEMKRLSVLPEYSGKTMISLMRLAYHNLQDVVPDRTSVALNYFLSENRTEIQSMFDSTVLTGNEVAPVPSRISTVVEANSTAPVVSPTPSSPASTTAPRYAKGTNPNSPRSGPRKSSKLSFPVMGWDKDQFTSVIKLCVNFDVSAGRKVAKLVAAMDHAQSLALFLTDRKSKEDLRIFVNSNYQKIINEIAAIKKSPASMIIEEVKSFTETTSIAETAKPLMANFPVMIAPSDLLSSIDLLAESLSGYIINQVRQSLVGMVDNMRQDFENEMIDKYSESNNKFSAVAKAKVKKIKVLIMGPDNSQKQHLLREFGKEFDFKFIEKDEGTTKSIRASAYGSDLVIWDRGRLAHYQSNAVSDIPVTDVEVKMVTGGLDQFKNALTEYYLKVSATPGATAALG